MDGNLIEFLDLGGRFVARKEDDKYLLVIEVDKDGKMYHKAISFPSKEGFLRLMNGEDVFRAALKEAKRLLECN